MLNIGITKFGSIINEENGLDNNIGHMLEVFNLIEILSKEHNIFITNNLRKEKKFKQWNGEKLDFLIVFNGMIGRNNTDEFGKKTLQCLKRYTWPVIETINNTDCPWIYIQPDVRYDINRISKEELKRQPNKIITLLGDEGYFGFDKIWMYGRKIEKSKKDIKFGLMYNDTNPKKTQKILNIIKYLKNEGIETNLKGKFKQDIPENTGVLKENEYYDFLKRLKYTVNISSDKLQITPRIWDCFINGVIAFTEDFDRGYKVLEKDNYLRINDLFDLEIKIDELEKNENKYKEIINYQYSLIKEEYLNGKFILDKFNELFKQL